MGLRYDEIQFATTVPNFINIATTTNTLTVSGSILNGVTTNFSTNINLSSNTTYFDIFAVNQNTFSKVKINSNKAIAPIYQAISTESVSGLIAYAYPTITFTISIFNGTGGTIVLTTQTYLVEVVEYQMPF